MAGADQFSSHAGGVELLAALLDAGKGRGSDGAGDPAYYCWSPVP